MMETRTAPTKGLMNKTMAVVHVRYKPCYISTKEQCEMTNFCLDEPQRLIIRI